MSHACVVVRDHAHTVPIVPTLLLENPPNAASVAALNRPFTRASFFSDYFYVVDTSR
jgi:hypothetical protein